MSQNRDSHPLCALHCALCTRRRGASALSLIEILIALFVFLVGSLGVLAVFPVVMNNAGRVIGETRGNMLSQSAVAQLTADCRVNFELPATGSAAAVTVSPVPPTAPTPPNWSSTTPPLYTLLRQPAATYPNPPTPVPSSKTGYFVTLLDGPGRGQSRMIVNDTGGWGSTITVAPAWTPVFVTDSTNAYQTTWTGPGSLAAQATGGNYPYFPNEHYSITRMGLPERPLVAGELILQGAATYARAPSPPTSPYYVAPVPTTPPTVPPSTMQPWPATAPAYPYSYGTFGLNRDLAIRSFTTSSTGFASPNGLNSGSAPNGFFAGIANPSNVQNNAVQVDPFLTYCGIAALWPVPAPVGPDQLNTLIAGTSNWPTNPPNWPTNPQLSSHYQVRIVSGTGAGQSRTITSNTATQLTVSPNWATPPDSSSWYEIGWANTDSTLSSPTPRDFTWCTKLGPSTAVSGPSPTATQILRGSNDTTLAMTDLTGKYVYLTSGTGQGQARAILPSSNAINIYVTPAFTPPPDASTTYELMESHGYVLITSGRATNRLFPIVWDQSDANNVEGHFIVCAGTDFQSLSGITAAQSGSQYNLQNATTFTVIGNQSPRLDQNTSTTTPGYLPPPPWNLTGSPPVTPPVTPMLLNAVPDGSTLFPAPAPWPAPWNSWPPPWFNTLDVVGHPNRLALDRYVANGATVSTSEFNYGVVFSDSGMDASAPVRVDVFVWRNFDINKDFVENQRPVGHMAGYIKRP
jgi:hypothetical protein